MTASNRHIPPILGALLVAFAPNVLRLPAWIVAWCLLCWGYCYLAALGKVPWLQRWIHQTLAVTGFVFGVISFEFALGRDAGIGLLSIMVGLKPLEIRSRRERLDLPTLSAGRAQPALESACARRVRGADRAPHARRYDPRGAGRHHAEFARHIGRFYNAGRTD